MEPALALAVACYVFVRLVQVALDPVEHGLARGLALLASAVAALAIVAIADQGGGALLEMPSSWREMIGALRERFP